MPITSLRKQEMLTYIARRLLLLPITMFGVSLFVFQIIQLLMPEERVVPLIGGSPRNPGIFPGLIQRYGFDRPFYEQYWAWLVGRADPKSDEWIGGILLGDFGYSRSGSMPTANLIIESFPATLELALWTILVIVVGGVGFGIANTFRHNKWMNNVIEVGNMVGFIVPPFLFALLLLICFLAIVGWFPMGRYDEWVGEVIHNPTQWRNFTNLLTIDALLNRRLDIFWNVLLHLIAPVITLSYIQCLLFFRSTRAFTRKQLRQEMLLNSKGQLSNRIEQHSTLSNGSIPVATIVGGIFFNLVNCTILAETIFNYPGIGRATVYNAISLDMIPLTSILLVSSFIFVIGTLLIDIAHVYMNRVSMGQRLVFWE
jgi:peptide/nickel transport system permease protein